MRAEEDRKRVSNNRALVKISGSKEQISVILNQLVRAFGGNNVIHNYPIFDRKTGFYFVFVNILNVANSPTLFQSKEGE